MRLTETLQEVVVFLNGRRAYEGELTVTNVISEAVTSFCEARLKGAWKGSEIVSADFASDPATHLREHTEQWVKNNEIRPMFRAVAADLENYLTGLENWCHQVECGWLSGSEDRAEREGDLLAKTAPYVAKEIESHFADYEVIANKIEPELRQQHRRHLMKAVHRFILQSPFSYRCFKKPLGYAGDYEMVNLMLGNSFQGPNLFSKLLNHAFLKTGPVLAHQNRITYLTETLTQVISSRAAEGKRTRILNLGCGPAQEIQDLIRNSPDVEWCDIELLDFSDETLRYTEKRLAQACEDRGVEVNYRLIEESIQGFLKKAARGKDFELNSYDVVYCAGLFDYLQQRFCTKLVSAFRDLAKPGGLVLVTNVSDKNTIPNVMEDFLEWSIIHRTDEEMLELAGSRNLGDFKELKSDVTRINSFLELRKAASGTDVTDVEATDATTHAQAVRRGISSEIRSRGGDLAGSELSDC
ncbi:MAG: class I SAM-dependent methyltransferase [Verrucomicrobiota bacterium]